MHLPRGVLVAATAPLYRLAANGTLPPRWQRFTTDIAAPLARVPHGAIVTRTLLAGRPAERISTPGGARGNVLYLHGGGYVFGSPRLYRAVTSRLAIASGATVHALDYRLAPEHPFPAAFDDALAAADELPDPLVIAGDSAGGGLGVAVARALIDAGRRPVALALLSPWTDPGDRALPARDHAITRAWLARCAELYLQGGDRDDVRYAPMHGDLSGLPPTLIHVAPDELLRAQIDRFAARANDAGSDVRLVELPGTWHSVQLLAGVLREATNAVDAVGAFIASRLND